jgi:hypothetical protein
MRLHLSRDFVFFSALKYIKYYTRRYEAKLKG